MLTFRPFYGPEYAITLLKNVPNRSKLHRMSSKCSKTLPKRSKLRDRAQKSSRALDNNQIPLVGWEFGHGSLSILTGKLLWSVFGSVSDEFCTPRSISERFSIENEPETCLRTRFSSDYNSFCASGCFSLSNKQPNLSSWLWFLMN